MGLADLPTSDPRPQQKHEIRPRKLEKADRLKVRESIDDKESAKVKVRSGGRCEAEFTDGTSPSEQILYFASAGRHPGNRCIRRAVHIHHRLGGIGVRGRGASALAANKLHVCDACHSDIHAHVLVPDGSQFRRVK